MHIHHFEAGESYKKPLLLLHGTGGDEYSLVDIAKTLSPESPILSLRGTVSEQGANRFFKRTALNVFDLADLEKQTDHLLETVTLLTDKYQLQIEDFVVVGYSNGANIAAHAMLNRPNIFKNALLFHPMSLGIHQETFTLTDQNIWLSYSENDPIVSEENVVPLINDFRQREAQITVAETKTGHQLTQAEVLAAKNWLDDLEDM